MSRRVRHTRGLTLCVLAGLACLAAAALLWTAGASSNTLADRTKAVALQIRCPICGDESIWDSPTSYAAQMRLKVRSLLADGESESEVKTYFVARFGNSILLAPPVSGIGLLIWFGPPVFLALGLPLMGIVAVAWIKDKRIALVEADVVNNEDAGEALDAIDRRLASGEITSSEYQNERRRLESTQKSPVRTLVGRRGISFRFQVVAMTAGALAIGAAISLATQSTQSSVTGGVTSTPGPTTILSAAQALVRAHPNSIQDRVNLGELYLLRGRVRAAAYQYKSALILDPAGAQARLDLAYADIGLGHARDAVTTLEPLLKSRSDSAQLWLLEGVANRRLGMKADAIAAFNRFLRLSPKGTLAKSVRQWLAQLQNG